MQDYSIINNAAPDGGSRQTLGAGRAVVSIDELSIISAYQSGLTFIAEVTVVEAQNDRAGDSRKIALTGLDDRQKQDLQWGRVKSLIAAVYNIDANALEPIPGQTWESLLTYAIGDQNPLKGYKFVADSYDKTTKNGNLFRVWSFSPYTG